MQRIGKYEITGLIGQGGFGKVYKAFDPTVGRVVAIKVMVGETDETAITRFRNEAAACGNLHHKNIVTVYDFGEERGMQYLVMEYLDGQDLQQAMAAGRRLSLLEKVDIMYQAADGLLCAHRAGIVHRDIKPANIMLLSGGGVKLMDFGIARRAGNMATRLTQQGLLIGTVLYMAPEQLRGHGTNELSDIWSYGVVFYELLAGVNPFDAPEPTAVMFKIAADSPKPLRSIVPEVPEELEAIINRTLAKDPEHRYQSLEDVLLDTGPVLTELKKRHAGELVSEARELLDRGNIDAAVGMVRRILDLDPTNADARRLREQIQREEKTRTAVGAVQSLLQRAEAEVSRKNYTQAVELFASALKLEPQNDQILTRLNAAKVEAEKMTQVASLLSEARKHLMKANLTEAVQQAHEALKVDPQNVEASQLVDKLGQELGARKLQIELQQRLGEARQYLVRRDYTEAIDLLAKLREKFPDAREVEEVLNQAKAGQREREQQRFEEIAKVRKLVAEQRYSEAVPWLERLTVDYPRDADIASLLETSREQLAIRQRNESIERLGREAWGLYKNEKFDEALRRLEEGLRKFPGENSLLRLKEAVERSKVQHEAEARFRSRVEECQRLRQNRRFADAQKLLHELMAERPGDASLAELGQEIQRDQEAVQRAAAVAEALAEANRMLAGGQAGEARGVLEKAAAKYPDDAEIAKLLKLAREAEAQQRDRALVQVALDRAMEFELKYDWAAALKEIEKGLDRYPNAEGLKNAAERIRKNLRNAERQQQIGGAAQAIEDALTRRDWNAARLHLDVALRERPDEEYFRRLEERLNREQARHEVDAKVLEAKQRLIAEDFDDALRLIEDGRRQFPQEPRWKALTEECVRKKKRREALTSSQRLLELSKFAEAEQALAGLAAEDAEVQALRTAIARERSVHEQRERYTSGKAQAEQLLRANQFDAAIAAYRQLLQQFPKDAAIERDLQLALSSKKEFETKASLDAQVAQLEQLRQKGDAAGVAAGAKALLAREEDPRARQLLRWAESKLAEAEGGKKGPNKLVLAGLGVVVLGAAGAYFAFRGDGEKPPAGVTLTPAALTFTAKPGSVPPAQGVKVNSAAAGTRFTVSSASNWLKAEPAEGTLPAEIRVRVEPATLGPGQHSGVISVKPEGGSGETVAVTLTVEAPPKPADPPKQVTQTNTDPSKVVSQNPLVVNPPPVLTQNPPPVTPPKDPNADLPPALTGPYYGAPRGVWRWSGELGDGQRITLIRGRDNDLEGKGSLAGPPIPGIAVTLSVPEGVEILESPSAANRFSRLILRNRSGHPLVSIAVSWRKAE
jgi:hypothetical protein